MKRIVKVSLGLIFTLLMITFSQASLAAGCDTIGRGQAAFFEHGNYNGACAIRGIGRYSNSRAIGIGNDKVSSIKLGPFTQVTLCRDNNFKGTCKTYRTNTPGLGSMNDKTSSAIVAKGPPPRKAPPPSSDCKPAANQAAFFEHAAYKGKCAIRGIGRYSNSRAIGIGNDAISSIKLGPRTQVTLCRDNNFGGSCKTYRKNTTVLRSMNDRTSSAIVEKLTPPKKDASYCAPNDNQAAVYEHIDYEGACSVLDIGNYQDSSRMGIANDTISSIKVGKNVAVIGFEHNNFRSVTLYTERNLRTLFTRASNEGDKISSIKVMRRNK